MSGQASLSQALLGKRALSWQAWALLACPSVILTTNTFASQVGTQRALVAGCANTLTFGVAMALSRVAFIRVRVTPGRMLAAYFLAGAVRALPVALLESVSWNPFSPTPNGWSLLTFSGLFGLLWLSLVAVMLHTLAEERQAQARLVLATEEIRQSEEAASRMVVQSRRQLREQLDRNVIPVIDEVLTRIRCLDVSVDQTDLLAQAGRIRELAAHDVRTLSHEVLAGEDSPARPITGAPVARMAVLREALRLDRIRGGLTLSISLLMSLSLALAWGGLRAGMALIAATAVAMAWLAFVEHLLLRGRTPPWWLTLASWVGAVLGYGLVLANTYPQRGLSLAAITVGGWVIIYLTLSLVDGLVRMHRHRTAELTRAQSEVRRVREVRLLQADAARARLGRLLHGPVQGRLASTALALRAITRGEGDVDLEDCARQLERTRQDLIALDDTPARLELVSALDDIQRDWRGLMEITVAAAPHVDAEPYVLEAVVECLSNAARHADARWAHVEVRMDPHGPTLVVTNPGCAGSDPVPEGAGWRLIRSSGGEVDLVSSAEHTTVTVSWARVAEDHAPQETSHR